MSTRPYVIYGKPWRHWIGGYRALHYLCHELNQHGVGGGTAYIATDKTSGYLRTPTISEEDIAGLGDFIAVYPERVAGNPYGAPTVVRWLLHAPGALGGECKFGDGELVFAWSELIRPAGVPLLWIPTVERELFNTRRQYDREGFCFYVGKGPWDTLALGYGLVSLNHENVPTREELAGILKRSELLYCYDNYTLLLWEAGLCGCPAVLIPTGDYTREQFEASEYGLDGIAWGLTQEEIERARVTVHKRESRYCGMVARSNWLLGAFVDATQHA